MKKLCFVVTSVLFLSSCKDKGKEKTDPSTYFPVLSFIKSQVAHVDTSLYQIIRVTTVDTLHDTTYLRREDFRAEARDFLELPDLTDKKTGKYYKEEKLFDETLNRVIITYLPTRPNLEIQRQELIIAPGTGEVDKVQTIIIDHWKDAGDSTIVRRMLWQVDKSFQVVRTVDRSNGSSMTVTREVIWNPPGF